MPFERQAAEALTEVLRLRLTPEEKQRIRDEAQLAGLTMSEFLRRRALGRTVLASVDMTLVRELRRLGGLLKHAHSESKGAYSSTTAAMLAQIGEFIRQVVARDR
jgi:hypothetical protein